MCSLGHGLKAAPGFISSTAMPRSPPGLCGLSREGTHAQGTDGLVYATCCKCISSEMLQPWCFKDTCFWVDFINLKKLAPSSWRRVKNNSSACRSLLRRKRRSFRSHFWANSQVNRSKDKMLFADSMSHQSLPSTGSVQHLLLWEPGPVCGHLPVGNECRAFPNGSMDTSTSSAQGWVFGEGSQTYLSWQLWRSLSAKGVLKWA